MRNYSLRDFGINDRQEFHQMAFSFYASDAVGQKINPAFLDNTFDACIHKSPYVRGVFICCDGQVAGYALLTLTYINECGGLLLYIDELYIQEGFRNRGLAGFFITEIFSEYQDKVACIELVVHKENTAAIRLYQKYGFAFNDFAVMRKILKKQ